MSGFGRLLDVGRAQAEACRRALAAETRHRRETEQRIAGLARERDHALELKRAVLEDEFSVDELARTQRWLQDVQGRLQGAMAALVERDEAVAAKRDDMVRALQRVKMLEKLEAKRGASGASGPREAM